MFSLIRLLILVGLGYLLYRWVSRLLAGPGQVGTGQSEAKVESGVLIRCDRCGVRVPENRALLRGQRLYCSAECRDQGGE